MADLYLVMQPRGFILAVNAVSSQWPVYLWLFIIDSLSMLWQYEEKMRKTQWLFNPSCNGVCGPASKAAEKAGVEINIAAMCNMKIM